MAGNLSRFPLPKFENALAQPFDRLRTSLPYLSRAFSLVWAAARRWMVAWAGLLLAQGLLPVATVYLTHAVMDSLMAALEASGGLRAWGNCALGCLMKHRCLGTCVAQN